MRHELAGVALLALASCQRPDNVDQAELDNLSARVTALEQHQLREQQAPDAKQGDAMPSAGEPVTMWAFEADSGSHRYATKARCEAALRAFEADRAAQDAASGVTVTRGTEAACNPL